LRPPITHPTARIQISQRGILEPIKAAHTRSNDHKSPGRSVIHPSIQADPYAINGLEVAHASNKPEPPLIQILGPRLTLVERVPHFKSWPHIRQQTIGSPSSSSRAHSMVESSPPRWRCTSEPRPTVLATVLLTPFRSAKYSRRTGGGALWSGADGPRPGAGRSARVQGRRKIAGGAWISLPGGTPSGRKDPRGCLGSGRPT
jgi:hypothetical protein